jgi:putative effector of murein hydrolase
MGLVAIILIFGFLWSPFVVLGLKRYWLGASVILALLAIYTAYVWALPTPLQFDEQDMMGAAAWQMILLVLVIGCCVAFASGFAISILRGRSQPNNAEGTR